MDDIEKLTLNKWPLGASKEQLLFMLQVVQAASGAGGSLTSEESRDLVRVIIEKLDQRLVT